MKSKIIQFILVCLLCISLVAAIVLLVQYLGS